MGQRIPEKEIVKQKFCKNFERGRLLVRRARRCNREDLEQFQFVWVTDRLRFGGCLRWFVGMTLKMKFKEQNFTLFAYTNYRTIQGSHRLEPLDFKGKGAFHHFLVQ